MTENATPADACDIAQAAQITGVDAGTIRYWADTGKIWKGQRRRRWVLVSPSEIERYDKTITTVRPGESEPQS